MTRESSEGGADAAAIIAQQDSPSSPVRSCRPRPDSGDARILRAVIAGMSTDVMTSATPLPRPAERVAIVSLLLVFLCGGVMGAVVMSYWYIPVFTALSPARMACRCRSGNGRKSSTSLTIRPGN